MPLSRAFITVALAAAFAPAPPRHAPRMGDELDPDRLVEVLVEGFTADIDRNLALNGCPAQRGARARRGARVPPREPGRRRRGRRRRRRPQPHGARRARRGQAERERELAVVAWVHDAQAFGRRARAPRAFGRRGRLQSLPHESARLDARPRRLAADDRRARELGRREGAILGCGSSSAGDLGENLLVAGVPYAFFAVGARYEVGGATIEISEPVVPCANLCKLGFVNDAALKPAAAARCRRERLGGVRGCRARVVRAGDVVVGRRALGLRCAAGAKRARARRARDRSSRAARSSLLALGAGDHRLGGSAPTRTRRRGAATRPRSPPAAPRRRRTAAARAPASAAARSRAAATSAPASASASASASRRVDEAERERVARAGHASPRRRASGARRPRRSAAGRRRSSSPRA